MNLSESIDFISTTKYTNFRERALAIYQFQTANNKYYQLFQELTGYSDEMVQQKSWWPFLPIQLFKSKKIVSADEPFEIAFSSSATSGKGQSIHHVKYLELYKASFRMAWKQFYPAVQDLCVLCLLPSYLEREGSSLILMAEDMVKESHDPDSGFFLYNHQELYDVLLKKQKENKTTLLLGVSFALLDFAEGFQLAPSQNLIVMETGGMKGRRKELIRDELHQIIKQALGVENIHSEYGMTELLSQAYSQGDGRFRCPPWMKVVIKDQNDPFSPELINKRGRICVIDLANIYSCAFIETEDLGIVYDDGSFEVLGRLDNTDIRGCNVMIT